MQNFCDFIKINVGPWLVGGHFNIISNATKIIGGSPLNISTIGDFNCMILHYDLSDISFTYSSFTWFNNIFWEWLDRVLFNNDCFSSFPITFVDHLSRTASKQVHFLLRFIT